LEGFDPRDFFPWPQDSTMSGRTLKFYMATRKT